MLKPSAEYNQRAAIIEDLRAGHSVTEIIRFFGYPRSIVYDVVTKYKALETVQRRFQHASEEESPRKNAPRGPSQSLKGSRADFGLRQQSLQKLASIVDMSEPTMHRITEEDLRYKSYILKIGLSEAARTSRVARCNLLLCSLKNVASGRIKFFSDEKIFIVDAKIN